jgi:hypothetical protein
MSLISASSRSYDLNNTYIVQRDKNRDQDHAVSFAWLNDLDNVSLRGQFVRVLIISEPSGVVGSEERSDLVYTTTIPTRLSSSQLLPRVLDTNTRGSEDSVNTTWNMQTMQPVVLTRGTKIFVKNEHVYYNMANGTKKDFSDTTGLWKHMVELLDGESQDDDSPATMKWMASPEDPDSILGVYITRPRGTKGHDAFIRIYTLTPFWWNTWTSITVVNGYHMVKTGVLTSKDIVASNDLKSITIDPEGIASLAQPCLSKGEEPLFSMGPCFAAAISEVPVSNSMFSEGFDRSELDDSTALTVFKMDQTIYGFGYGSIDVSTTLALAVITAYAVIISLYVAYTITTGHTSLAWNSPTELIVLALQSETTNHLSHVSVGIDSIKTFQQSVGIRVNTINTRDASRSTEKLELVFENDRSSHRRRLRKIKRNKAY